MPGEDLLCAPDWPGEEPWQALPKAAQPCFLIASSLSGGLSGLLLGMVATLAVGIANGPSLAVLAIALAGPVLGVTLGIWRGHLAFYYTRWQLDDDGLRVRRGRFWRSETMIPRARVQHLDIERGPLERRFGLATLVVHTAGARISALRQPGFDEASALHLRDALVPMAREHDDRLPDDRPPDERPHD